MTQQDVESTFDMNQAHDIIGATPPHLLHQLVDDACNLPQRTCNSNHLAMWSSQQHDQQVDMQCIVQGRQRFDIARQEHVASRYQGKYSSAVAAMEAKVNLPSQQQLNFIEVEARAYFDARWSALKQEAQIEFAASRTAQLESAARFEHHLHGQLTYVETNLQSRYMHAEQALQERLTHADTTHATTNLLQAELDQACRQNMTQMNEVRSELHQPT
eukprot:1761890-Amphidinium_carterae.1